jgi:hypothetical protein
MFDDTGDGQEEFSRSCGEENQYLDEVERQYDQWELELGDAELRVRCLDAKINALCAPGCLEATVRRLRDEYDRLAGEVEKVEGSGSREEDRTKHEIADVSDKLTRLQAELLQQHMTFQRELICEMERLLPSRPQTDK